MPKLAASAILLATTVIAQSDDAIQHFNEVVTKFNTDFDDVLPIFEFQEDSLVQEHESTGSHRKLSAPWNDVEVVPKLRDPVHEKRHGGPAEKGEKHLAKALLR